jgi:hypothetical protein
MLHQFHTVSILIGAAEDDEKGVRIIQPIDANWGLWSK